MSAKGEYDTLLEIGALLEIHPELTGDWAKDASTYTKIWETNIEKFGNLDVTYEELGGED